MKVHEYGLMEDVVASALEAVRRNGGGTVRRIRVDIGELSFASPDALLTAFQALSEGTPLAGAEMEFGSIPGALACDACGFGGSPEEALLESGAPPPWLCPECAYPLAAVGGMGIVLAEVGLRTG